MDWAGSMRCAACGIEAEATHFTKAQRKKPSDQRKCPACAAAAAAAATGHVGGGGGALDSTAPTRHTFGAAAPKENGTPHPAAPATPAFTFSLPPPAAPTVGPTLCGGGGQSQDEGALTLAKGAHVVLANLKQTASMNGWCGVVASQQPNDAGRWEVEVLMCGPSAGPSARKRVLLRPENLVVRPPPASQKRGTRADTRHGTVAQAAAAASAKHAASWVSTSVCAWLAVPMSTRPFPLHTPHGSPSSESPPPHSTPMSALKLS